MRNVILSVAFVAWALIGAIAAVAQQQAAPAGAPASDVVSKSTRAVGYQVGGGDTKIDLNGTQLLPGASAEVKVEATRGATAIEVNAVGMTSPTKFGTEFLTYVLWAVSPEGRTSNLGELQPNQSGQAKL